MSTILKFLKIIKNQSAYERILVIREIQVKTTVKSMLNMPHPAPNIMLAK